MYKKLGELKTSKKHDYYNAVAQVLEEAGFKLVLEHEGTLERFYSVAINMEDKNEKENEWIKKARESV